MTRVAAAALCVLVGMYWLAVGSVGSRPGGGGFLYAATFPLTASHVVGGLGLGAALLALTAAAMFPDPAIFARVLGCL